jgi:ABC-2 type transporter
MRTRGSCACGRRGVGHHDCGTSRQYTASPGAAPPPSGPAQGRLFGLAFPAVRPAGVLRSTTAAGYGGLYFVVALATRNAQAPLALAPLFLPLQFLSTQFVPEELLPRWVQTAAAWNPFTYMVDAARAATTGPLTFAPVGKAVLVGAAMLVVTQVAARWAFSRAVDAG